MMKIWIKNVLLGWLLLLFTTVAVGQELVQAEYFIDKDTGSGNGTAIAITSGASLDESFTFSTAGLAVGNHTIYIRTKQAGDRWSIDRALFFYVQDTVKDIAFSETRLIVAAEYFVDTDPQTGNGTSIPVTTSGLVEESFTVSTNGLAVGEHKLYVRTQDDSGVWSLADAMDLYIQDTVKFVPKVENRFIVAAEYYIDSVRAVGKGSVIPVTVSGEVSSEFSIQTAGLSNGAHKLYVRTQGNDGLWSLQKSMGFAVLPTDKNLPLTLFTADTVDTGAPMTFTNLSDSVDENTTYKWDVFDDGVLDFTTADITYTFDTTGLIPVRLTAFNGSDSSSYLGRVLVGDFTNRSITASGSTDLCEGEEVIFTAPVDYLHYAWNTGDSTQMITVSKSGNYFVWLTDNNGFTIKSETVSANVTPSFSAMVQVQNATTGQSNGFAEVIVDRDDLAFSWSNGTTATSYLNGLAAGNYSVDVSSGQCSETLSFTVSEVTPAANDIVQAEYFFDTDPGVGLATALNISSGQEVNFAKGISTTGLTLGNHKLFVRTMDNEGLWSLANQMSVFIQDANANTPQMENRLIVAAEYFFDTEPGIGSGSAIAVPTPVASISEALNIDVSALSNGDHTLYVRTQSDDGIWSIAQTMDFQNCATAIDAPLADNITACPSDNVILTATGDVNNTYLWFKSDSTLIENQTAATYTVGAVTKDAVYYVAQKDALGCRSAFTEVVITAPQFEVFAGVDFEISNVGNDYAVSAFYPETGTWSGSGISELGVINRAGVSVSDYTHTYAVDTLNCTFTDTRVLSVLDLKEIYNISIEENQVSGTALQQIISNDVKSYATTLGEATAIAVDNLGQVTIADSAYFDFEVNPTPAWTIYANQSEEFTYEVNLNVTLTDAADAPVILDQEFSIAENSSINTIIGAIVATDQDSPALTYAFESGNENGVFSLINENQIAIADSSQFDFETNVAFNLSIAVSDGALTSSANVTVNVSDVNESPDITAQTFSIDENSVVGTTVGTVIASDPDNDVLSYSITAGNTNSAFAIDGSTGLLTVADVAQLDFETTPSFSLTVQVADAALNASATITINLNDVDESVNQAPQISDQTFAVDENSANGTSVGSVVATDPESDALTYSITNGNTNNAFAIDGSTGLLTVSDVAQLDFETTPTFTLTVQVADATLNASATITINLNDVDESVNQAPQIAAQTFSINENSANGTSVGSVVATDPESDALTYSITNGNTNNAFAIDGSTGLLTVADVAQLDFETTPTFTLTVQVADAGLSASATITINLNDIDESVNQAPQISDQTFTVNENSANGTSVGTVVATDPESDALTYSITAGNTNNAFAIDGSTGLLTVSDVAQLDFESTPTFTLTVHVADAALNASATITVNLNDIDESVNQAPQISDQTFTVNENSDAGTVIGMVQASDADGDALNYSITSGNTDNAFAIGSANGELIVVSSNALDFANNPTFDLTVMVNDGQENASATISITVEESTVTSIDDLSNAGMLIYPNPALNSIALKHIKDTQIERMEIVDMTGKKLEVDYLRGQQIEIGHLKSGFYQLLIYLENDKLIQGKFMKQ